MNDEKKPIEVIKPDTKKEEEKKEEKVDLKKELAERSKGIQVALKQTLDQLNQLATMKVKLEAKAHALSGQLELIADINKQK